MRPSQFYVIDNESNKGIITDAIADKLYLMRIWRCWMREPILPLTDAELDEGPVCAYVVDDPGGRRICGSPRRQSSSYCPFHHSLCYIVSGSKAEF